jgi:ATP-binding cassette, subfamily F, member 3
VDVVVATNHRCHGTSSMNVLPRGSSPSRTTPYSAFRFSSSPSSSSSSLLLQLSPSVWNITACSSWPYCAAASPHHHHHRRWSSSSSGGAAPGTALGPVVRFKDVSFGYTDTHLLLDEVNFSIAQGSKVTIMGQNGSGKSTIVQLMTKQIISHPSSGQITIRHGERIGYAQQTIPTFCREWTIDQFFTYQLTGEMGKLPEQTSDDTSDATSYEYDDDDQFPKHEFLSKKGKALKAVQLHAPGDRTVQSFSGGQQARLLLAAALIQNPSILILDEPTNNMDANGLDHLQNFIMTTDKTCIVISHDEAFLNSFTDQVLYLDIHSKKVEPYMGDYFYVKSEITKRIQRENAENARRQQKAIAKKEQANKFANKGGNLRKIAKTMRQVAAEMEEGMVDVRKEDLSLKDFVIPYTQPSEFNGKLVKISQITGYNQSIPLRDGSIEVRKGSKIRLCGPNGIGKSTFLELLVARTAKGVTYYSDDVKIGYYRQDFYNFDFSASVLQCLEKASNRKHTNGELFKVAASFLLRGTDVMKQAVGTLSEGQKGLLSLACLYVQQPTILVVDEPTNHINFRHIPALIYALSNFEGALFIVSHDEHFIQQIGTLDTTIDMGKEFAAATNATTKMATKAKMVA